MYRVLRKFTRFALAFVCGTIGALLILGFFGRWIPLADSAAHFRFHLVIAAAGVMILLSLLHAWRWAGYMFAAFVAGIVGLTSAFPDLGAGAAISGGQALTLVQLNLYYRNGHTDKVVRMIRDRHPDLVTLQELSSRNQSILATLAKDYPSQSRCFFAGVGSVAVLSRFPTAPGQSSGCVPNDGLAWVRVMVGDRPLTVASIHLRWPYPFGQVRQINRLEPYLKALPRPVLIGGDFNAATWSHAVDRIEQAADVKSVGGLRFTLHKLPFPSAPSWTSVGLPIDHVLLPRGMTPNIVDLGPDVGSDHLPVVARLFWG